MSVILFVEVRENGTNRVAPTEIGSKMASEEIYSLLIGEDP